MINSSNSFSRLDCPVGNFSGCCPANKLIVIDIGHQHLKRGRRISSGGGNPLSNHIKERFQIIGLIFQILLGNAELCTGIDNWKIKLVFGSIQLTEQVKNHINNRFRPSTGAINLIDHNNRFNPQIERFLQHKTGLGHRSIKRIHQQQNRIDHL